MSSIIKSTSFNKVNNSIVSFVLSCLFILGCTKEKEGVVFTDYSISTGLNIYQLQRLSDSVFFVGGGKLFDTGFVYKSTNGGKTWQLLTNNLYGGIYGIYFKNEQSGYATAWNTNIYQTADSGKTFSLYSKKVDNIITSPLFVNDSLTVAVSHIGYENGYFWKTTDQGKSWDTLNLQRAALKIIKSYNDFFISCYGLVLFSDNQGMSWQNYYAKGDLWVDIDFPSYNTGYLTGFEGNILKTTDRGKTWQSMRTGNHLLHKSYNFTESHFISESIGVVATYEGDILYTQNGGYHWEIIRGFNQKTIRDIHLLNYKSGMAVGDEGTIFFFHLP
jgi:photosystem II stability/assembly factor-like uncharacterized protein